MSKEEIEKIGHIDIKSKQNDNYFNNSKFVKELSYKDFDQIKTYKLKDDKCTFIMFYAPWCGYCKKTKDVWEELGHSVTFLNIFAFNCEENKSHLNKMNMDYRKIKKTDLVNSYPTLIMYKKKEPFKIFEGERNFKNLMDFCMMCKKN